MITRTTKRIFQIGYSQPLSSERTEVLRRLGYEVVSVIGNESAKVALTTLRLAPSLFIVGHSAPEQTRQELVQWLKANYPNAKVLALNSPDQQLPCADYNAIENGPEKWLPFISAL